MQDAAVVVIMKPGDRLARSCFVMRYFVDTWRSWGWKVAEVSEARQRISAPLAIDHISLTRRPREFQALIDSFPRVLNGSVSDISKRAISTRLLRAGGGYRGPVIVKTDLNCGGMAERSKWRRRWNGLCRRLAIPVGSTLHRSPTFDYKVYDSPEQVPARIWSDPRFVVEEFRPERVDGYFCARNYFFFGEVEFSTRYYSRSPIIKVETTEKKERMQEIPEGVREFRRRLGMDYGKFDFVMHDGEPFVFDVSKTPTTHIGHHNPDTAEMVAKVAAGILSFPESPRREERAT